VGTWGLGVVMVYRPDSLEMVPQEPLSCGDLETLI
jgi:hypothetical protein